MGALTLSRGKGQTIVIGGNIVVTITEIRSNKVRISVEAPMYVSIHRGEVQNKIDKEMEDKKLEELFGDGSSD